MMILIWSNGDEREEAEVCFFEIGGHPEAAAVAALRLVDPDGEVLGTTENITWAHGGATELFVTYIARESAFCGPDFKARMSAVGTPTLNVIAARLQESKRPRDDEDVFAREIIDEARWRNRPPRRRRSA